MTTFAIEKLLACLVLAAPASAACAPGPVAAQDETWTQAELEAATERIRVEIEEIRGERFLRPVEVRLTDAEGFERYMTARVERLVTEEDLRNEEMAAKLLGLVPAEMDMWEETFAMLEGQVGGFYDPGSDTFYLMDSFTGPVAEVILSHELTHALDDQLYDIDGTLEVRLDQPDAAAAYQAVVEGSGTSMMQKWAMRYGARLTMEDLQEAMDVGADALAGAPLYLWKPLMHAYNGGLRFLDSGYKVRKREGKTYAQVVEEAFRAPPLSTEQVLHPDKYWKADRRDLPRRIELSAGELPEGWTAVEERVLGELVLAILVDEASDVEPPDLTNPMEIALLAYTNEAAEGWGGDSMLLLTDGAGGWLAQGLTVWDSAKDAREFRAALEGYREEWTSRLGALDREGRGHGLRLLPESSPDAVAFTVWAGVPEELAERVASAVSSRELPAEEAAEDR